MNAAELERNGFSFFTCIEECCVVIEKNIDRKPAKRELVTKYDKNAPSPLRLRSVEGGLSKSAGVQIRCDTGYGLKCTKYPESLDIS